MSEPQPTPTPESTPASEPFVSPLAQTEPTPQTTIETAVSEVEQQAVAERKAAVAADSSYGWGAELNELDRGWIENKGFKNPEQIVTSYRSMEKQQGGDPESILRIPGENATDDERAAFVTKLGRPTEPAGYQFSSESPEDVIDITGDMRQWAFDCGMSQKQAEHMHSRYQTKVMEVAKEISEERNADARREDLELQREWGPEAYKTNMHAARRFMQKYRLTGEDQQGLEQSLGFKRAAELMAKVGRSLGEHAGPGDGLEDSGSELESGLTPAAAKDRIRELQLDPEWWAKYERGDPPARKRFANLHAVAYPQGSDTLSIARR